MTTLRILNPLRIKLLVAVCVVLAPLALTAQSIRVNWRLNAPFSSYKTYVWVPGKENNHPFYRQYVDEYVNYALKNKKHLVQVSADQSPDLRVEYHFLTQETMDTNTTYWGTGGWGGWGWGGWGWGMGGMGWGMGGMGFANTRQVPRTMGILTIDMFDAHTNKLVWRGQASEDSVDVGNKNEEKQVAMSIFKMMKRFPPRKK